MSNNNIHPTRIFKTDIELLNAWNQYKQYLIEEAKKWPKIQYVGKDGQRVEDYPVLPYSLEGFEVWYYNTFKQWIHQYFKEKDGYYQDFVPICSHIRKEIRSQQITGGMLGMFNPSITQRLNNLVEKTDNKTDTTFRLVDDTTGNANQSPDPA
jgi:hypothetical protein